MMQQLVICCSSATMFDAATTENLLWQSPNKVFYLDLHTFTLLAWSSHFVPVAGSLWMCTSMMCLQLVSSTSTRLACT